MLERSTRRKHSSLFGPILVKLIKMAPGLIFTSLQKFTVGFPIDKVNGFLKVILVQLSYPCLKNDHKIIERRFVNTTPSKLFIFFVTYGPIS